jgi:16S rRNA (guanine527-N7)-methyltransferase
MVDELGIPVEIFDCRAESLLDDFRFSVCTARAVGPLDKLCRWFSGNWYSLGRLLAVKGPRWVEEKKVVEQAGLMKGIRMTVAAQYPIPGQDWDSFILKIWPVQLPEPGPNLMGKSGAV